MSSYTIASAKEHLSRLIDEALAGEPVTITRDGLPVAKWRERGARARTGSTRLSAASRRDRATQANSRVHDRRIDEPDARRGVILVDTNVLVDIASGDPNWKEWSIDAMTKAMRERGPLVINAIIYAECVPAGTTQAQAEAILRAHGQGQLAQMLSGTTIDPGHGIDFTQLGWTLEVVAQLYILGAVFSWAQGYIMAGVAQRTVSGMRRDVEAKLARLPLKYFDSHPHGDMLSRVTNDIDNVTTTLQQGLSQLLTSVLTIVGVLAMMLWISPAPRPHLAGDGAGLHRRHAPHRPPLAEAVHRPVGSHRLREQSGRADPYGPCPGAGLRAEPAAPRMSSIARIRRCTSPASGRSSSPASSSRR